METKRRRGRPRKVVQEVQTTPIKRRPGRPRKVVQSAPVLADPINHPAHYTAGGVETIDFIEAKKLGYNLGNVVKYVARSEHKGAALTDLKKARWYLDREIANREKGE